MSALPHSKRSSPARGHRARNREKLHPQPATTHSLGKNHSVAQTLPAAHTILSDYSDAPRLRRESAGSPPFRESENPSAIRSHKSADTARASRLANPPEIQTVDNSASAPATHPRHCTATGIQTNILR